MDVLFLCALVTAAEQHDKDVTALHKIDPIAWPNVDTQFAHAFADGPDVTGIAQSQSIRAAIRACTVLSRRRSNQSEKLLSSKT